MAQVKFENWPICTSKMAATVLPIQPIYTPSRPIQSLRYIVTYTGIQAQCYEKNKLCGECKSGCELQLMRECTCAHVTARAADKSCRHRVGLLVSDVCSEHSRHNRNGFHIR